MKKKILISLFVLLCVQSQSIETKIIHNIQNETITNIDIKNEFRYLVALNNSLKELDEEKILNISNESAIREKIKKIEISKNFKEIKLNERYSELLLKNIYSRLNLKSIDEFETYLKNYDLKIIVQQVLCQHRYSIFYYILYQQLNSHYYIHKLNHNILLN